MVIKGKIRGNGKQLGEYLMARGDNETVSVLEVSGTATKGVENAVFEMGLKAEQSRSNKGLYHAQISPDIEASKTMTPEQWLRAVDVLAEELDMAKQPRVVVLHEKKGKDDQPRTHAHVVWQRYDDEKKKIIDRKNNYYGHDRARAILEKELKQERTPQTKDEKELITQTYQNTPDGHTFLQEMAGQGMHVYRDEGKRSRVKYLNQSGTEKDLVRQITTAKTKEVRDKLKGIELPTLEQARQTQQRMNEEQRKINQRAQREGWGKDNPAHIPSREKVIKQEGKEGQITTKTVDRVTGEVIGSRTENAPVRQPEPSKKVEHQAHDDAKRIEEMQKRFNRQRQEFKQKEFEKEARRTTAERLQDLKRQFSQQGRTIGDPKRQDEGRELKP